MTNPGYQKSPEQKAYEAYYMETYQKPLSAPLWTALSAGEQDRWRAVVRALWLLAVLTVVGCASGRTLDPRTAASEPHVVIVYPSAVCARRYDNPPPEVEAYDRAHIVEDAPVTEGASQ